MGRFATPVSVMIARLDLILSVYVFDAVSNRFNFTKSC